MDKKKTSPGNTENLRFIDLFCGIGGVRLGFEKNGFKCVFSSDFNKHCQITYERNFGEKPFGDIAKVNPDKIPDFEVLTGGFPCQPFSISGKKKGFDDVRGTLFFDICRIIDLKKPKVIVLENVKHLMHHDKKRTFTTIITTLENLGYNITYELLNIKDFGLPQNRERIFIIGSKKGFFDFSKVRKMESKPLRNFLDEKGEFSYLNKNEYTLLEKGIYKQQEDSKLIFIGYRNKEGFKKGIRPNTLHLNRVHRQPNRIYSIDGYHPTLPSQEPSGRFFIYIPELNKVRKLTSNECYRIMGFPESFIKNEKIGESYKQIGNSVGVPILEEISYQIIKQKLLDDNYTHKYNSFENLLFKDHES